MKIAPRLSQILIFVLLLASISVALFAQEEAESPLLPEQILFEAPGIQPEGVVYDAIGERFLVGSLTQGTIFEVSDDGSITPFIEDEDLISSVGLHIDEARRRLLAPNSDATIFSGAIPDEPTLMLAAYDLETGERLFLADLRNLSGIPVGFANDVTVDDEGNAYVTDSLAPVIYLVTTDGEASIFVENQLLGLPQDAGGSGLNGIDYHPDGYLLAAVAGTGTIVKIPLDDPDSLTRVVMDEQVIIDGMVLTPELDLVSVARIFDPASGSAPQFLAKIRSEDDWNSATIIEQFETSGEGTTVAQRGESFYMVNVYFSEPNRETYDLARFDFADDTESSEEPVATDCVIAPAGNLNVNIRSEATIQSNVIRALSPGDSIAVDDQTLAADGFVWWRVVGGGWVRSDVVNTDGNCEF